MKARQNVAYGKNEQPCNYGIKMLKMNGRLKEKMDGLEIRREK